MCIRVDAIFCSCFVHIFVFNEENGEIFFSASHLSSFGCERQDVAKDFSVSHSVLLRFDSSFKMCATDSAMHAKQNDFDAFNFRFKFFKRLKSQVLNYKREEMAIHLESPK